MYSALAKDWLISISHVWILYNECNEQERKKKLMRSLLGLCWANDYENYNWNGEGERNHHTSMQ